MLKKIKAIILGFVGGVVVVFAFILGRKLHDNGDRIKQAGDELKDAGNGIDSVSDRIKRCQDTVADSLGIIERVRKRKEEKRS